MYVCIYVCTTVGNLFGSVASNNESDITLSMSGLYQMAFFMITAGEVDAKVEADFFVDFVTD